MFEAALAHQLRQIGVCCGNDPDVDFHALGTADAVLLKYEAEARGIKQVIESKSSGYAELVKSCAGDAKSAATLLMIEKIEQLVTMQVEAIKNLKIDKITVWDSGAENKNGNTTANFLSGFVKSLPPLHDIAEMAGLDLPKYLGRINVDERPIIRPVGAQGLDQIQAGTALRCRRPAAHRRQLSAAGLCQPGHGRLGAHH